MQWIVGHELELFHVVIYIGYQNAIDSLQWNVELISELNYGGASNPVGLSGLHSKLMYHDDIVYEGQIGSKFILVHKGTLIITQGYIDDNEQGLQIRLID